MKSIRYLERDERNIKSLLEMLGHAVRRMADGKDVPPYLLKEILELIQTYNYDSHKIRENIIPGLPGRRGTNALARRCEEIYGSLRKYNRFLLKVVDTYDIGYDGARGVFSRYAGQYLSVLTDYFVLVNKLIARRVGDQEELDREVLRQLKKINEHARRVRTRRLVRMEMLRNELSNVAA
jgi:hemerythrin-like domain-containing protein